MQRSVKVQGNWDKGHHENITWINISYFLFHLVNYLIINYNFGRDWLYRINAVFNHYRSWQRICIGVWTERSLSCG